MRKTIIGSMAIVSALVLSACSFGGNSSFEVVTDEYDFNEGFENIEISITCEDIHIMASEDDECHIVFSHPNNTKNSVEVKKDTLVVKENTTWGVNLFNSDFKGTKLDIYLPESEFEKIDIDTASADITVDEGFVFDEISIDTASGDTLLTSILADSIQIKTASGNVTFEECDAQNIDIDTASGDISGTLLSGKDFNVDTASGNVNVPSDSEGGSCDIDTASGDVNLDIA